MVKFLRLFLFVGSVSAFSVFAKGNSLHDIMKQIGRDYNAISRSSSVGSQAPANADRAAELAALFTEALNQVPDSIAKMPLADQPEALKEFQRQIGQMIEFSQQLEQAFVEKKLQDAATLLEKLKAGREIGHTDFKE